MSLAKELEAAKARMEAQKKQEQSKKKKTSRSPRRATTEWKKDDEIIALYLYLADSSKFLKENYAKKRKLSVRAMSMKISAFEAIDRGKVKDDANPQTMAVYQKYSSMPVKELLTVVISILRGEYTEP